tara:strand:- start:26488 stop:28314 length:1827 start_codon:yes stop_codon:yes gene_type:complete
MATELDNLIVKIEADLSSLQKGLDDAKRKVGSGSKKMGNDFRRLGDSLDTLGGRVIKFGGLLAGVFGVIQIKKVVDVGIQIENLQVRLKALFGTAEEGARAFDVMVKFASRVPFSLEEIQQASGNLAVVSKDANELAEVLEITGNVASATGLDFRQASEQIQRSFAGGIASADVFRERGVRAMLGFNAGVKVSINDTIKAFKEKFSGDGEFGNVMADFAKTLTGTLSMLGDKLFSFRKSIAEEFMVELKRQFGDLDQTLANNQEAIEEFGREVGRDLADLTASIVKNLDTIKDAFEGLFLLLAGSVAVRTLNFIKNLNIAMIGLLATIGLVTASRKQNLEAMATEEDRAQALLELNHMIGFEYERVIDTAKQNAKEHQKLRDIFEILGLDVDGVTNKFEDYKQKLKNAKTETSEFEQKFEQAFQTLKGESVEFEKIFDKAVVNIGDAFGDAVASGQDFKDAMKSIFQNVVSQVVSLIVQLLILKPLLDSIKKSLDTSSGGGFLKSIGTAILGSLIPKATGGFVAPNKPHLVGERGAEMFVPHSAGNIVPNNQLGGSVNVVQNISFSTGIVPTVRAEVLNLLPQIKEQTINAVAETRQRGGSFARTFGG